ncbi:MAG: leucine-rich repeat domain-containing protein, partial [Oscillospiraceae bacterium]|nr:leucine-rich repeat domain-containing protein [Oscillospiraceae bacterium]
MKKLLNTVISLTLCLILSAPVFTAPAAVAAAPDAIAAKSMASAVLVNGENILFDAYNINNNNYFKLRDLAHTLSGTKKQFEVSWNGETKAISLTSGAAYTPVGGEMSSKGAEAKTAAPTGSAVYLDGTKVSFTAYNIENNNYFKLRDIGQALDFGVEWDGENQTVKIDTDKGYTPEATPEYITIQGEQYSTSLTELDLSWRKLTGDDIFLLRHMKNLTRLNLSANEIYDITPLAELTKLTSLGLSFNKISDLTPLSRLTDLTTLVLRTNLLSDLTPLAELTNLTYLDLSFTQISDVTPLAGLTNLTILDLGYNKIADITPLTELTKLEFLGLKSNQVIDLTPLSGLTKLV